MMWDGRTVNGKGELIEWIWSDVKVCKGVNQVGLRWGCFSTSWHPCRTLSEVGSCLMVEPVRRYGWIRVGGTGMDSR